MINDYRNNPQTFLDKFSIIVAMSENNVIGKENKLLWNLPKDLKNFSKVTKNKIVIMGKNTYLSLPNGALPSRLNIVMCNDDLDFLQKSEEIKTPNTGIVKLRDIQEVFNFVYNFEQDKSMKNIDTEEIFVIGGGKIYELFLPYVSKLYLTLVHTVINGDTYFNHSKFNWAELSSSQNKIDEKHEYEFDFKILKKYVV